MSSRVIIDFFYHSLLSFKIVFKMFFQSRRPSIFFFLASIEITYSFLNGVNSIDRENKPAFLGHEVLSIVYIAGSY